jgi:hypothetical protein
MIRSRLGLKVLGLCALALGLMAFVASAAQAEELAHWNIINAKSELVQVNETNKLFAQLEINKIENETATLLFTTAGGTKVGILCKTAKFDEGGLLQAHGGISLGRILFEGCVVLLNEKLSPGCQAHTTGQANGKILTEKGKGLIVLDVVGGVTEDYTKIVPDPVEGKESLTFAKIEMGEECSIGELVEVKAKADGEGLWIKDCAAEGKTSKERFLEESKEHLIEESLHGLVALGQPATIDGSALVRLAITGEHNGLKWGGTPG